jgi:hypothetical protein
LEGIVLIKSSHGISEIEYFYQDSAYKIYINPFDDPEKGPNPEQEETIGAGFFDSSNNSLYYYSSKGLMKARINEREKSLSNIVKLVPPLNSWYNGVADKQEFAREVRKVFNVNGSLVFYHRRYGLFIFNNGELVNLQ